MSVTYHFSPSLTGLYIRHSDDDQLPEDAVEISEPEYQALLDGSSAGQVIVWDAEEGKPALIDHAPTWDDIRAERRPLLRNSDWTQMPDSPLSPEKKAEWATYRQALRDITSAPSAASVTWPVEPE